MTFEIVSVAVLARRMYVPAGIWLTSIESSILLVLYVATVRP